MRKLDYIEYKTAQDLADVFQMSVSLSRLSSPVFIKRFIQSDDSRCFFNKSYLVLSTHKEDYILPFNENIKGGGKKKYNTDEMYWLGYMYASLSYLYDLSGKAVFSLLSGEKLRQYYPLYHTFDIEEACERIMENIGYKKESNTEKGLRILRKLVFNK